MNKKNIHVLLVVLAVLVGGIFFRQQQVHRGVVSEDYAVLDFTFDNERAVKIMVSRGGKAELTAVKNSTGWTLPDLWNTKADSEKVESFLKELATVRGELRADDASLLADFGITDESALSIQLADDQGTVLADLRVGDKRAGPASVFIRRAGSSAVFLADVDLFRLLGVYSADIKEPLQPRLWADLEPLSFRPADLTGLEGIRYEGGKPITALQLKRETGENKPWTFVNTYGHFSLDAAKVEAFIQALSTLRASSVVDPAGSYGFDTPALQFKIQAAEKLAMFTLGNASADQKSRYLRVDGDASVYEVAKFTFEDLLADDGRFFTAGLPDMGKTVVEAVTLTKQGQEKRFTPADANAFDSILQTLRTFEHAGLLLSDEQKKKGRSPGLDTITIEIKGGAKMILDLGERIEGASEQEACYAAQLRSDPVLFSIRESDYNNLFEALKPPAISETNASQPATNKAE